MIQKNIVKEFDEEAELFVDVSSNSSETRLKDEVKKWRQRFIACLALTIPLAILAYILPLNETSNQAIQTKIYNGILKNKTFIEDQISNFFFIFCV